MRIDSFRFGSIEVDGKKYGKDVVIDGAGNVDRRKGGFLKFGSHRITVEELRDIAAAAEKPDLLIGGLGTAGAARLDPEAEAWAAGEGVELFAAVSPEAVERFNREQEKGERRVAALIHVTC
jgi:hypothetical protein